jgi:hypothetical protein
MINAMPRWRCYVQGVGASGRIRNQLQQISSPGLPGPVDPISQGLSRMGAVVPIPCRWYTDWYSHSSSRNITSEALSRAAVSPE